jgi:hypothetical protein
LGKGVCDIKEKLMPKYKHIARIDQKEKRTFGWYVRVHYNGKSMVKFFPDLKYEGKSKALAAAVDFRNEAEYKLKKPRTDLPVVLNTKSNTGVTGVVKTVKRDYKNGLVFVRNVYEVTCTDIKGKVFRTCISIEKYGKKKAFEMACELRREKEIDKYGAPLLQ